MDKDIIITGLKEDNRFLRELVHGLVIGDPGTKEIARQMTRNAPKYPIPSRTSNDSVGADVDDPVLEESLDPLDFAIKVMEPHPWEEDVVQEDPTQAYVALRERLDSALERLKSHREGKPVTFVSYPVRFLIDGTDWMRALRTALNYTNTPRNSTTAFDINRAINAFFMALGFKYESKFILPPTKQESSIGDGNEGNG